MAQENIDLALKGFPLFEAEDFEGMARVWHRDGRVMGQADWPEPGPFEGQEAILEQFRVYEGKIIEANFRWTVEEALESAGLPPQQ
jgi:hypothetical protein